MLATQQAVDTFIRPDAPNLGANWVALNGTTPIVSNGVQPGTTASLSISLYNAVTLRASQYAEVTVGAASASDATVSAVVRGTPGLFRGYLAVATGPIGPTATLGIMNMQTFTNIAGTTINLQIGDVIRIEAEGNIISAYQNGIRRLRVTDSNHVSGFAGIAVFANTGPTSKARATRFACGDAPVGLLAEYRAQEGSGTQLTDFSNLENHGTLGSGGFAPTWISQSGGLRFSGGQYVTLPSALNTAKTIIVFLAHQKSDDPNTYSAPVCGNDASANASIGMLLSAQTVGAGQEEARTIVGGARAWAIGAGATKTESRAIFQGVGSLALVMDTLDRFYFNGIEPVASRTYFQHNAVVGLQTSGVYQLGGSAAGLGFASQTYFTGPIYYALFFSTVLSAAEVAEIHGLLVTAMAARGLTVSSGATASALQIVADGDSITEGYSSLALPYTASLNLPMPAQIANQGRASLLLADMVTTAAYTIDPLLHPPAAFTQICVVWGGTNDFSHTTAAQTYALLQSYCASRRALGWKLVVVTMISRVGEDTFKNDYNALIRAGVGVDYDVLADVAAEPLLGADGAYLNATYFPDQIHPSQTAQTNLVAPIIRAAILLVPQIVSPPTNAATRVLVTTNSATLEFDQ